MRSRLAFPLLLMLLFMHLALAGCSTLRQIPPPPEQVPVPAANLAQGYILLAQVRLLAADAVRTRLLNVDEGKRALQLTDDARKALDSAREAHFNNVEGAANKGMQIAEVILTTLRNDIESKITQRKEKAPK